MTKLTFLIIAICIAFSVQSQNETIRQLEIKGGYLIDTDDQRFQMLDEDFGDEYKLNYDGLRYVAIGYTETNADRKLGIEIDYFNYKVENTEYRDIIEFPIASRSSNQIQFSFFYGEAIVSSKKAELYFGPIASIAFRENTLLPNSPGTFPLILRDYIAGVGGKIQANYNLTEKIGLSLGSKLMVLDFFVRDDTTINKTKTFDFIRGDIVLQMGLVFSI